MLWELVCAVVLNDVSVACVLVMSRLCSFA
jgi:hypothetical protein